MNTNFIWKLGAILAILLIFLFGISGFISALICAVERT